MLFLELPGINVSFTSTVGSISRKLLDIHGKKQEFFLLLRQCPVWIACLTPTTGGIAFLANAILMGHAFPAEFFCAYDAWPQLNQRRRVTYLTGDTYTLHDRTHHSSRLQFCS